MIGKVHWHSYEDNLTQDTLATNHLYYLENYLSKFSFKFPRDQWVNVFTSSQSALRWGLRWQTGWYGSLQSHYHDVIMGAIASQINSLTIVYPIVYSDADQRKHQSSASLAFVRGIHRWPVNSPHKWPVTRKMFPFDDVIMFIVV